MTIVAYCDGSSVLGKTMGVGVYFPAFPEQSFSQDLSTGRKLTNIRAELFAIKRCLEKIRDNPDIFGKESNIVIKTDSQFSINVLTIWWKTWAKKEWKTSSGEDVQNKGLIINIIKLIKEMKKEKGRKIDFIWVKGHQSGKNMIHGTPEWLDWFGNKKSDELSRASCNRRIPADKVQGS